MTSDLIAYRDPDYGADRGEGVEAAWALVVTALPPDAVVYSLAADSFLGRSHPGGWEARAIAYRDGWERIWQGHGATPAAALRNLADLAVRYPRPGPDR